MELSAIDSDPRCWTGTRLGGNSGMARSHENRAGQICFRPQHGCIRKSGRDSVAMSRVTVNVTERGPDTISLLRLGRLEIAVLTALIR